jgi:hypothetical protein
MKFLLPLLILFASIQAQAANQKPIANAGPDQSVAIAAPVKLDGTGSLDPDGGIKKFQWKQIQGVPVQLQGAKSATPAFISPAQIKGAASSMVLGFKLTVTDNKKAKASDTVLITVQAQPVCVSPQVLQGGVCATPQPVCPAPQILQEGACITPPPLCAPPQIMQNGVCITPAPACIAPQILQNGRCVLAQTTPCDLPKVLNSGVCGEPTATKAFNDTGVSGCSDASFTGLACPLSFYPGQDADSGRDTTHYNDGDGHAGFSFGKLDAQGQALPAAASAWACVQDKVTGLVWELKTDDGGLRDKDARYTHYSPGYNPAGEYGAASDAQGYVQAVNTQGLCGAHDWRLPTAEELQGLVDYSINLPGPTIDAVFFIHTPSLGYWTRSPHARNPGEAWVVYFDDGRVFEDLREHRFALRLVRSAQ